MGGFYVARRKKRTPVKADPERARWNSVLYEDSKGNRYPWPLSDIEGVREAQLEGKPGHCAFCDRPLTYKGTGRLPVICFRADCALDYYHAYNRIPRRRAALLRYSKEKRERNRAKGLRGNGKPRTKRYADG